MSNYIHVNFFLQNTKYGTKTKSYKLSKMYICMFSIQELHNGKKQQKKLSLTNSAKLAKIVSYTDGQFIDDNGF